MLTRFYYSARGWLVAMLAAGVGYYLFWNLARLTRVEAGIIVLIEAALINWAFDVWKPRRFERFYIRVEPEWAQVLGNHCAMDEEKWAAFNRAAIEEQRYGWVCGGITITVLEPELFWLPTHEAFSSKPEMRLRLPLPEEKLRHGSWSPVFYVKVVLVGRSKRSRIPCLQFGLVTAESLSRDKRDSEYEDGVGELPLANLPYSVFGGYTRGYDPWDRRMEQPNNC